MKEYNDPLYLLRDKSQAAFYLNAALEQLFIDHNKEPFLVALRKVIKAHGRISNLAKLANISVDYFYEMLSAKNNPSFEKIISILSALGFQLTASVKRNDPLDSLRDKSQAISNLNAALEQLFVDHNKKPFLINLRKIAEANGGIPSLAKLTNMDVSPLYRTLSGKGNPSFKRVILILSALGLQLNASVKHNNHWNPLRDKSQAASYLNAALEQLFIDHDKKSFLVALRKIVEANGGISSLAKLTNMDVSPLYRTLSAKGNPFFERVTLILSALGLKLTASVKQEEPNKKTIAAMKEEDKLWAERGMKAKNEAKLMSAEESLEFLKD